MALLKLIFLSFICLSIHTSIHPPICLYLKLPGVLWLEQGFFCFVFFKFIYFWLCWVLVSVRGLSPVAASGGHSSSRCAGLSLSWPLLLRSTGSRRASSVVVAHGPSCSAACGIFPDQGSNPCPLHRQADSQPLRHQGSPRAGFFNCFPSVILNIHFSFHRETDSTESG